LQYEFTGTWHEPWFVQTSITRTRYPGDFAHGAGLAPVGGDVHLEHDLLQKQKEPDGLVIRRRLMQRTNQYRINQIHFEDRRIHLLGTWGLAISEQWSGGREWRGAIFFFSWAPQLGLVTARLYHCEPTWQAAICMSAAWACNNDGAKVNIGTNSFGYVLCPTEDTFFFLSWSHSLSPWPK
jgi:hypothetical protein